MSGLREKTVDDLWQSRNAWATASRRFQVQTQFARYAQLGLIIAGAVLATATATGLLGAGTGTSSALEKGFAGLGAACLTLVSVIQVRFLTVAHVERWPRARSVAEAIKSEIYRFQAGAHPYEATESDKDLRAALLALTKAVDGHIALADDLLTDVARAPRSGSAAPGPLDRDGYLRDRVDDQIQHFYLPRSRDHSRGARRSRQVVTALSLAGAAISALMAGGIVAGAGAWVSVLTTVSLAIATHASLQRSEFLAMTYAKQARRLKRLRQDWTLGGASVGWTDFVNQCEETISAENRAWMAEMVREVETLDDVPIERPLKE